jgi:DNA-binding CsgD family transcriptional regulator
MNTWLIQTQNLSLEAAVNTGSEWTLAEARQLEIMKASGKSIKEIAKSLGRSYYSVSTKLVNIGAVNHHKHSNKPLNPAPAICGTCFTTPSKSGVCLC